MRNLIYYVACSVDRFIAQPDGSTEGFLYEGEHMTDLFKEFPETIPSHLRKTLGIESENRVFDTVLMGRKTYEVGLPLGVTNPYATLKQYVFSSSVAESPDANIVWVRDEPLPFVRNLKHEKGKDIWLCGRA